MGKHKHIAVLGATLLTAGCATTPTGPMVEVMPAANKPFEVFAQEQTDCEHYARDAERRTDDGERHYDGSLTAKHGGLMARTPILSGFRPAALNL